MTVMQNIKTFLANLTHHPGVYQMLDDRRQVLYVGKAKDLKKRLSSYYSSRTKDLKTLSLIKQIKNIDITVTETENEAVLLECNLIKEYKPRYNILLRDDKSFPYILITHAHPFPKIELYRGPKKKKGLYFGPYPNSYAVRDTINLLQKLFQLRTCRDTYFESRGRPCLLYQIGRCSGSCMGLISAKDYAEQVKLAVLFLEGKSNDVLKILEHEMESASDAMLYEIAAAYRDQIRRLRSIQQKQYITGSSGDADVIGFAQEAGVVCIQLLCIRHGQILGSRSYFPKILLHVSQEEIVTFFIKQHYLFHENNQDRIPKQIILEKTISEKKVLENILSERSKYHVQIFSPKRGEKMKRLKMAAHTAKQSLAAQLFNHTNLKERLIALKDALKLSSLPKRIECIDISHSMGEAVVGACVVFDAEGPKKSDYRRYNILGITGGDDIAAIRQLLMRRFKQLDEQTIYPDLIIIDGGKAQLHAAFKVLAHPKLKNIYLMGVSKGPKRKPGYETLHFLEKKPVHLPADSKALHFIQQIRDEAHRFAITAHRQKRDKTRLQSSLELIPGVGAKRRKELLRYFGGIQGVAHASLDELNKVSGISHSLAERIFATFHDATV